MIRAADLQGKRVVTESGERRGRVDEIHIREGVVTELVYGGGGVLQRFVASRRGRHVAWDKVRKITAKEIVIADSKA